MSNRIFIKRLTAFLKIGFSLATFRNRYFCQTARFETTIPNELVTFIVITLLGFHRTWNPFISPFWKQSLNAVFVFMGAMGNALGEV
jgi:hypothetical protein